MNNPNEELRRRLEQATARSAPRESNADDETARLREGWMVLGRLLETALPPREPAHERWSMPLRAERRHWRFAAVVGVAVSLAILVAAIGIWQRLDTSTPPSAGLPQVAEDDADRNIPTEATQPIASSRAHAPDKRAATTIADPPQWDDSFDDQLARAGQNMLRVEENWGLGTSDLAVLQYGMEQVRRDVEGNDL